MTYRFELRKVHPDNRVSEASRFVGEWVDVRQVTLDGPYIERGEVQSVANLANSRRPSAYLILTLTPKGPLAIPLAQIDWIADVPR